VHSCMQGFFTTQTVQSTTWCWQIGTLAFGSVAVKQIHSMSLLLMACTMAV